MTLWVTMQGGFQQAGVASEGTNGASHLDNPWCFYIFKKTYNKQGRTSESSTFMSRIFFSLPIILFTILLGMSFHYGAAAGSVSAACQSVHLNSLADLSDDSLLFTSNIVSIQERNESNVDDSHTGQSCSLGVCASCVPAVAPDFIRVTNAVFVPFFQHRENQFIDSVASTLFRPPIS